MDGTKINEIEDFADINANIRMFGYDPVANKVGSSMIAILAKHYGIPCYRLGPMNTIDFNTPTGNDIVIEERPSFEVTDMYFDKPVAPKGVKVYNPAFDITPADLLTGIITEKGIVSPKKLATLK